MTDQKLVDELEKALRYEAYDGGFGYMGDEQFTTYVRGLAVTAAEVVEKAHTPTHDEREALVDWLRAGAPFDSQTWGQYQDQLDNAASAIEAIRSSAVHSPHCDRGDLIGAASAAFKARGGAPEWEEDPIARDLIIRWHLRGFEDGLAAGFRRSEVPEPSAEGVDETAPKYQPCHFDTSGMYARSWCHTHGVDHLMPDGNVYVQGHRLPDGLTYTGPMSVNDLPQGEPSDARVEAAARRLFGATVDSMDRARELARVALTAPPLIACPHWVPGKITFRNGCTACTADPVTEAENR